MNFFKKLFDKTSKSTSVEPKGAVSDQISLKPTAITCRECGSVRFINQEGQLWCAQCGLVAPTRPSSSQTKQSAPGSSSSPSKEPAGELVSYRGLTFKTGDAYSLVWDDKRIVRGIWYGDRNSLKNAARHRMVVAAASVNGFTVLDSDYQTTVVGGIGGVENLQDLGGAILWFDSTREIFGQ